MIASQSWFNRKKQHPFCQSLKVGEDEDGFGLCFDSSKAFMWMGVKEEILAHKNKLCHLSLKVSSRTHG